MKNKFSKQLLKIAKILKGYVPYDWETSPSEIKGRITGIKETGKEIILSIATMDTDFSVPVTETLNFTISAEYKDKFSKGNLIKVLPQEKVIIFRGEVDGEVGQGIAALGKIPVLTIPEEIKIRGEILDTGTNLI